MAHGRLVFWSIPTLRWTLVWLLFCLVGAACAPARAHLQGLAKSSSPALLTGCADQAATLDEQATIPISPAAKPPLNRVIAGTVVVGNIDSEKLRSALEALPHRPCRIVMVTDDALPSWARTEMRDLDGFVPAGSRTIYLRRQSVTLREAESSGGPYLLMLAAVIWHEIAHVEGCDEAEAQRREEELWWQFVRTGRVEGSIGLTHLNELRRRR